MKLPDCADRDPLGTCKLLQGPCAVPQTLCANVIKAGKCPEGVQL